MHCPLIHHTRAKKAYHADPEDAEWTTQKDPTDPRETKIILRKKKKTRSRTSPLQDGAGQRLLLLSLTNAILNPTSVPAHDNVFISWAHSYVKFYNSFNCWVCGAMPLSVMDRLPWWVSPLRYGNFIPLCCFLEQQKGTFLSLTNHNLSLLSWCKKKPSMDQGHRVTFKMNTSLTEITKAYTSYMKLKEEKGSLTKG